MVKNQGAWVQFLVGEPRSHMLQGNEVCQPWVLNHTLGSLHTSVKTLNSHTHKKKTQHQQTPTRGDGVLLSFPLEFRNGALPLTSHPVLASQGHHPPPPLSSTVLGAPGLQSADPHGSSVGSQF